MGYASFTEIVRRFQDEDGVEDILQARHMAAMLLAFDIEADADGKIPNRTPREWCDRMELILVQEGYQADGSDLG